MDDAKVLREGFGCIQSYAYELKEELGDVLSITGEVASNQVVFTYKGLRLIFKLVLDKNEIQLLAEDYIGGPLVKVGKCISANGRCECNGALLNDRQISNYINKYLFK